tara:strand:- start:748 stop:1656 length:909 start_codon:yes stop_codon:yes gene_type:complete
MAEQELAENNEATAAAMAAAAVVADIDMINGDRQNEVDKEMSATQERGADPSSSTDAVSGEQPATTYLMVKELRTISRARSLRLQPEDLIVAIDGAPFHKDIETFLDIMFECDPENGRVLTIWRNGILFNVLARGPLGCVLEHAKPDVSDKATDDFQTFNVEPIESYITFEVLRDIYRTCMVLNTRLSPIAMIFPPLWLMQNRLWEVLIATFLIYGSTLAVHWVLFILAYVLLSMYFRKAHLVLRRSFGMMRGRHIWLVVAEKSELDVQRLCRRMDPKCVFVPDLVGPPVVDEPPKKRRRRR